VPRIRPAVLGLAALPMRHCHLISLPAETAGAGPLE
jgi:hypothetical protein